MIFFASSSDIYKAWNWAIAGSILYLWKTFAQSFPSAFGLMIAEDQENHHFFCSDISYWIDKPCYVDHDFFDRKCFARYVELKQDDEFKSFDDKHSSHYLWEYCLYYLILVHLDR